MERTPAAGAWTAVRLDIAERIRKAMKTAAEGVTGPARCPACLIGSGIDGIREQGAPLIPCTQCMEPTDWRVVA
jgi:hypothetical protein